MLLYQEYEIKNAENGIDKKEKVFAKFHCVLCKFCDKNCDKNKNYKTR